MPESEVKFIPLTSTQIIGSTPRWIVRWGITVIFVVLIVLVTTLSVIKYPVLSQADASLEFLKKPAQLMIQTNSTLVSITPMSNQKIEKGTNIMRFEEISSRKQYDVASPVTGRLYWMENWNVDTYIKADHLLGFVIPEPNERIAVLRLSEQMSRRINPGQQVIVRFNDVPYVKYDLVGNIDYIEPRHEDSIRKATIRFSKSANDMMAADTLVNTAKSVPCSATITIDTISYLQYLFQRVR